MHQTQSVLLKISVLYFSSTGPILRVDQPESDAPLFGADAGDREVALLLAAKANPSRRFVAQDIAPSVARHLASMRAAIAPPGSLRRSFGQSRQTTRHTFIPVKA